MIQCINNNDFIISDRSKNKQFMRKFRLNHYAIKNILLNLEHSSFIRIDNDRSKEEYGEDPIVIFKISKNLVNFHGENEEVKIYIKLKLLVNKIIPIISFHEAEF